MKKMKRYSTLKLIQRLMTSKLKHLDPSIRHFLLWIKTNILLILTNLQMISINGHFLSHQVFTHMIYSSPNIYHTWLQKAPPFFNFENYGAPFVLTYANLCQQTRSGHCTRNSKKQITTSLSLSSHQTIILNIYQGKNWSTLKSTQSSTC